LRGPRTFFISEGLNNVVKHSGCGSVEVLVSDNGDHLVIEVVDQRKPLIDKLTDRECDVRRLMAEGYSNKRIGRELHLAVRSVETYIANILVKLELPPDDPNTHRRVQAVITWLRGT
jgi:DNA-binding NarL/FixJ family response regulator